MLLPAEIEGLKESLNTLIEKRKFFKKEKDETNDAGQKFFLSKKIEEIDQEVREIKEKLGLPTENPPIVEQPPTLYKIEIQEGFLAYHIPQYMTLNQYSECIFRVAIDKEILLKDLKEKINPEIRSIDISHKMKLGLTCPYDKEAFDIKIDEDDMRIRKISQRNYSQWLFYVRPLKSGIFILKINIFIVSENEDEQLNSYSETVEVVTKAKPRPKEYKLIEINNKNSALPAEDDHSYEPASDADEVNQHLLFLSADPVDLNENDLQAQYAEIVSEIQQAGITSQSIFHTKIDDLIKAIDDEKPSILHFTGHGKKAEEFTKEEKEDAEAMGIHLSDGSGLILTDKHGRPYELATIQLKHIFKTFKKRNIHFELVFLNACHSKNQAEAVSQYVDYVIATTAEVGKNNAQAFAKLFYNRLATGQSIPDAFELAQMSSVEFIEKAVIYSKP